MKAFLTSVLIAFSLMSNHVQAQGIPKTTALKGRYIMKGATCAGLNFISNTTVLSYPEVQCDYPDTLKLKWLNANLFTLRDKTQRNKSCPPRVYIYQIVKNDGKQLVLKSIWMGWNDFKDELITYAKQ